jgi:hypothetical protein
MSFQIAVRTTERFGPRAVVAGAKCNWAIGELGPWQGAIPTPLGVPIPVYATIPLSASLNVEGSLSAFRLNLASTSVLNVDLGRYNNVGFWQEGSNAWVDGVLQISGRRVPASASGCRWASAARRPATCTSPPGSALWAGAGRLRSRRRHCRQ